MNDNEIIEQLYNAFSRVKKPSKIIGCWNGCCMTTEEGDELLLQDIRTSDKALITLFQADVLMTVGDAASFKYYLPRILELAILEPDFISIPESFMRRLAEAGLPKWTENQRRTVERSVVNIIQKIDISKGFYDFEDWLIGLLYTDADPMPFVKKLDAPDQILVKYAFLKYHIPSILKGRMEGPFWDDIPEQRQAPIFDWLKSKDDYWIDALEWVDYLECVAD